jgi:hypothetical protein
MNSRFIQSQSITMHRLYRNREAALDLQLQVGSKNQAASQRSLIFAAAFEARRDFLRQQTSGLAQFDGG